MEGFKRKVKCFDFDESPYERGKYRIIPIHENFHLTYTEGSFAIIAARVLGISFPDYLRLCRDEFGGEIIGKNTMYPVVYFERTEDVRTLLKILNAQANLILFHREHPDYEEHKDFLKKNYPRIAKSIQE